MPSHDFDAARRERLAGLDPVTFTLGGVTFACKRSIPFEVLLRTITEERTVSAADLFRFECAFIADCLDADLDLWEKVLTNPADPVIETDVEGVVRYLVEVYGARPTSPSSGSSAGRKRTGGRSSSTGTGRSQARKRGA